LLARVDGKSPVEYLDPLRAEVIREFVRTQARKRPSQLEPLVNAWFDATDQVGLVTASTEPVLGVAALRCGPVAGAGAAAPCQVQRTEARTENRVTPP
jgi:hypothetical protein